VATNVGRSRGAQGKNDGRHIRAEQFSKKAKNSSKTRDVTKSNQRRLRSAHGADRKPFRLRLGSPCRRPRRVRLTEREGGKGSKTGNQETEPFETRARRKTSRQCRPIREGHIRLTQPKVTKGRESSARSTSIYEGASEMRGTEECSRLLQPIGSSRAGGREKSREKALRQRKTGGESSLLFAQTAPSITHSPKRSPIPSSVSNVSVGPWGGGGLASQCGLMSSVLVMGVHGARGSCGTARRENANSKAKKGGRK